MKRVLFLLILTLGTLTVSAQDFASRFLKTCSEDSTLTCISVSPKMMDEVLKSKDDSEDVDRMKDIISDLKSMQILTSKKNSQIHFEKAKRMLENNMNRYIPFASYREGAESCQISIRKRGGVIIELVMLQKKEDRFRIINFTGNMDQDFIHRLMNAMNPKS